MSRAHDLAWAAGFFDGEGYITIGRRNTKAKSGVRYTGHYLRIGINHVAPEPLHEMQRIFGGKIEYSDKVIGNRKPRSRWTANTRQAAETLKQLMPYFRNKQRAAELGLEFQSTIASENGQSLSPATRLYRELLKEQLVLCNSKD